MFETFKRIAMIFAGVAATTLAWGACGVEPVGDAMRHPLVEGSANDAVLRVERVKVDERTVHEAVSGADDAESLVASGGHAISIELGSDDGHTSAMVFAVQPIEERPADLPPLGRGAGTDPLDVESEDDVLGRVLDATLLVTALNAAVDDDTEMEVLIGFDEIPQEPIANVVARERRSLGLGPDDEPALRAQVVAQRFEEIRAIQAPVIRSLEDDLSVDVVESFVVSNTALARIPRGRLRSVALREGVRRVEENRPMRTLQVDAWEAARAAQLDQYINAGYTGNRPNPTRHSYGRIALGVIDFYFEDDFESIGDGRFGQRWDCTANPCTLVADLESPLLPPLWVLVPDSRHGTAVAQIASGRAPTPTSYRNARSGSSRDAALVLATVRVESDFIRAIDRMGLSAVDIVNSSMEVTSEMPECTGTTVLSNHINDLSRIYGTLFVQAAGNSWHTDPSACTMRDPAGATYAFPVGGLLDSTIALLPESNYSTIQTGGIFFRSSRGNVPYLGGYRSVVGTSAVASQVFLPNGMPNTYAGIGHGTSFAAPLIAGAAVDMRDWWLLNGPGSFGYGTGFMNDPGFTYVQLLLMGDRQLENGTRTDTGFDGLFGNGRFRARVFNTAGMDDPWKAQVSAFYITQGQTSTFHINGGLAVTSGVDRLVVAMWWPESNYPGGADIVMAVRQTCGTGSFNRYDYSYDNKKRIFIDGSDTTVAGRCWAIDLTAYSAPASAWQGGLNRRYIYLAYYYEDEARDDLSAGIQ